MSVAGFFFHVWRTMPSMERQMASGAALLSLVANSTKRRSGLWRSASYATRNAPRFDPVPPMEAWISLTFACGLVVGLEELTEKNRFYRATTDKQHYGATA